MGLTKGSVGRGAIDGGILIEKKKPSDCVVALAGNPNVGKSTVFNGLTGMNQHTGNWPGKTVSCAVGRCDIGERGYIMVDIPGTYSLMAHSAEEVVARDFICFGGADAVVVVCDATCLERNLNLVLQIMETSRRTVLCLNMLDEARRKGIGVDTELISKRLGIDVVGVVARKKKSLAGLVKVLDGEKEREAYKIRYCDEIEEAIGELAPRIEACIGNKISARWASLRLLDGDEELMGTVKSLCDKTCDLEETVRSVKERLSEAGFSDEALGESIASSTVRSAEEICRGAVTYEREEYSNRDRRLDKVFTSRATGYPVMIALLAFVFWLTVYGANYISELLSGVLFGLGDLLGVGMQKIGAPDWLYGIVVDGVYRVLAWVVSVMLPPMAIFFPLFTLLEDSGYLPRVAYNLDRPFCSCNACGKQALTMCMGFGCNAAGVVGCRIIDSKRERLLATLTNSFVPCNGKFPMLISIITAFFIGSTGLFGDTVLASLALCALIVICVLMTFFVTCLLSRTLLRGTPSSFTLELPPYRRPQVGSVIVRSVFDRTLFVLGRAVAVAAPAGAIIWIMANVYVGDASLLSVCADFLDPFARAIGLDGVILMAFILGFPASEIVIPIMIMAYMAKGSIAEAASLEEMAELFIANGWTPITALCVLVFSLFHWPCSTTLMTVKKETGSVGWTLLSALLPTALGIALCFVIKMVCGFLHYYI